MLKAKSKTKARTKTKTRKVVYFGLTALSLVGGYGCGGDGTENEFETISQAQIISGPNGYSNSCEFKDGTRTLSVSAACKTDRTSHVGKCYTWDNGLGTRLAWADCDGNFKWTACQDKTCTVK